MPYDFAPDIFKSNRPEPTPEEDDVFSYLKSAGLGAIGYLGNILDTPGSFVRGIAAGEPGRAFTGLLNFGDRVSGKELAGLDDNPDSYLDDAGGIATEIALDPLTYLTIGASALGRGGKIAKAAGLLPKAERAGTQLIKGAAEAGVNSSLRELAAQSPEALQKILTAAEGSAKPGLIKRGITSLTGHEFPVEDIAGQIKTGLTEAPGAGGLVDESLRGGLGRLRVPFTDLGVNFGDKYAKNLDQFGDTFRYGNWLGALPEEVKIPFTDKTIPINPLIDVGPSPNAGIADAAQYTPDPERLFDFNPIRTLAPYFNARVKGGETALGQLAGQEATDITRDLEIANREKLYPLAMDWNALPDEVKNAKEGRRELSDYIETAGQSSLNQIPQPLGESFRSIYPDVLKAEQDYGVPTNEFSGPFQYNFADQVRLPGEERAGNGFSTRELSPTNASQNGRLDFLTGNTQSQRSAMSQDPLLVAGDLTPAQRQQHILDNYGFANYDQAAHESLPNEITKLRNEAARLREIPPADIATKELLDAGIDSSDLATRPLSESWSQYRAADLSPIDSQLRKAEERLTELDMLRGNVTKLQDYNQTTVGDKYLNSPLGILDSDPINNAATRMSRSAKSIGEAKAVQDAMAPHILEGLPGNDDRLYRLDEGLKKLSFASDDKVTQGAIDQLAKKLGKEIDPTGMSIPKWVVDDLTRVRQPLQTPKEINKFLKLIDRSTNFFKTYALFRPAFFTRNLVSGQTENALNGLFNDFSALSFGKIMAGEDVPGLAKHMGWKMTDQEAAKEIARQSFIQNIIPGYVGPTADISNVADSNVINAIPGSNPIGRGVTIENAKKLGQSAIETAKHPIDSLKAIKEWFKSKSQAGELNPFKGRGIVGDETQNVFLKAGEDANHVIEGYNRGGAFVEGLRQGIDPKTLADKINAIQVQYGPYTSFESNVVRRGIPFYGFTKGKLPQVARELAQNPGGPYGQLLRGMKDLRGEDEILPDHLKNTLAIPLGTNDQGDPRYLTGLGLMPEDSYGLLGSALGGGGLGTEFTSMLNPLIKAPIEMATGRSLFQGREIADQDPVIGRIASNIFGGEPIDTRALDTLLMNTIPSPLTFIKSATDSRKGLGARALNSLTGVKVTDVPEKTQEALGRQQLQELLRTMGGHRYEQFMMPKDELAKLPPDQQEKARVIQQLLKELSDRAKKRAKAA
jgi:hypothetical protein